MSDLFGNHIVGFPTRRLICFSLSLSTSCCVGRLRSETKKNIPLGKYHFSNLAALLVISILKLQSCSKTLSALNTCHFGRVSVLVISTQIVNNLSQKQFVFIPHEE